MYIIEFFGYMKPVAWLGHHAYLFFGRDNPFIEKQFITKWLKIFNKNILKSFYNDRYSVPIYYLFITYCKHFTHTLM
jgi:hypothetical protein